MNMIAFGKGDYDTAIAGNVEKQCGVLFTRYYFTRRHGAHGGHGEEKR
jgi:hypothetical protein